MKKFKDLESITTKIVIGIKWYGNSIKQNYKQFIPALIVSSLTAAGAQELTEYINNAPEWLIQSSGYLGATIGGYGAFLPINYRNNKKKYPNGFFSKETIKTIVEVASADYLSDIISYAPVFVGMNHYLLESGYDSGTSGLISATTASTAYFFTVCGLYNTMQTITNKTNKIIKNIIKKYSV